MTEIELQDGRKLGIDPLSPVEGMLLAEGCRELSGVRRWWSMALNVGAVRSIDGIPLPALTHEKHVEGMIGRFSRADLDAIAAAADAVPVPPGPRLELSELTPLETLRAWAVIGEMERLPGWVGPAFISLPVRSIDGVPVEFPTTRDAIKETVSRLGWPGFTEAAAFLVASREREAADKPRVEAAAKN